MEQPIDLREIFKPTPFVGETMWDLDDLERSFEWHNMNMSPSYQRDSVWTLAQRQAFMGHLLSGGDVLPLVVQRVPDSGQSEMLDGKQRLETMLMWVRDDIAAELPDGRLVRVSDLVTFRREPGKPVRVMGLSRVTVRIRYVNLPFEERKRFYVRFNSAGTPHTREELERAMAAVQQ